MLDTALTLAYSHYTEVSRHGWRLAFVLARTGFHALALLCMLLFSAFFLVFVVREVVLVCAQLLRHCARVGGVLLGVVHHARVNDSVYVWTKVLSSGELSSMQ